MREGGGGRLLGENHILILSIEFMLTFKCHLLSFFFFGGNKTSLKNTIRFMLNTGLSYISNTNSSVSLRFQTTRKLLKHEGLRARVFYCFRVVCHRNETRRMSVWNNFSNEWNGINCFSWYLRTLECTAYHD